MSDQLRKLGLAVRAARRERGWSQTVLAKRADLSRPTVARVELGKDVSTVSLGKIAEALGLSVGFLNVDRSDSKGDINSK